MKSYMGKTSLSRMAGNLRKAYNSTMNKAEIENRLAEMALKQANGQDITADTETLARDLVDKLRGIKTENLQYLKGTTLTISEQLQKELREENLTMKDVRSMLKGSGVNIKVDKQGNFRSQWADLRENNGALPNLDEEYSESGALHRVLDYIAGEVQSSTGAEQFGIDLDEVALMVRASVGNVTTYLTGDAAARAQINNLMKQIAETVRQQW